MLMFQRTGLSQVRPLAAGFVRSSHPCNIRIDEHPMYSTPGHYLLKVNDIEVVPQLNQGDEDGDDEGDSSGSGGSSAKSGGGGGGDGVALAQKLLDEAKAPCAVTFRDPERYKVILTIMNGLLRLFPCMRMALAFIVSCFRRSFLSLFFGSLFGSPCCMCSNCRSYIPQSTHHLELVHKKHIKKAASTCWGSLSTRNREFAKRS